MSDGEGFLARWSRRKRSAAASGREQPRPEAPQEPTQPAPSAASSVPESGAPVDLANLPPIDSIGAGSDISAFLAAGVPAALTRAALRRAWAADPAIRDFIGLSENSWDFTAPGGVPGFGSVTPEEVRRLLTQLTGDATTVEPRSQDQPAAPQPGAASEAVDEPGPTDHGAPNQLAAADDSAPQHQRRRHGSALPE